jgi:hypothetical protein
VRGRRSEEVGGLFRPKSSVEGERMVMEWKSKASDVRLGRSE